MPLTQKRTNFTKTAFKRFNPLEINGINLGFSESKHGAAFGERLRRQVISDAFDIVKKGILYPEIFQLVSLFEENIGPDRLSDMISTIIYPNIVAYTKRIQQDLKLNKENYPNYMLLYVPRRWSYCESI